MEASPRTLSGAEVNWNEDRGQARRASRGWQSEPRPANSRTYAQSHPAWLERRGRRSRSEVEESSPRTHGRWDLILRMGEANKGVLRKKRPCLVLFQNNHNRIKQAG